jgi:hypothetical protein
LRDVLRRAGPVLAAAVLYALAVPFVYRPWFLGHDLLPKGTGPLGSLADADLYLNVWILGWIAHAAITDPARLLDGNIFHPATGTIVGSENMLAHLPFTAPVLALTGNALLVLKAYVLESLVLSGLGMFLFVRHHTRSAAAALVAGAALTFTAFRTDTVPQPQYLGIGFLPLALLAIDLYLESRLRRWLALVTAALVLQALACVYLGFFAFLVVPVYALVRVLAAPRDRLAGALHLAVAGAAAGLLLIPAMLPYLRGRSQGMILHYDLTLMELASWRPTAYLSGDFVWRAGVVAIALVVLDLVRRVIALVRPRDVSSGDALAHGARSGWRSPEGALWIVAATAAVLASGPYLTLPGGLRLPLPYVALHDWVPGFSSLRVPIRFVIIVAACLAALAGFAFARATSAWQPRLRALSAVVLLMIAAYGAAPHPAPVMAAGLGDATAPVYRWLAAQDGPGAVLEIPAQTTQQDVGGNLRNGRYMVASTTHWRPLLNGWTAYPPPSAGFFAAAIRELPAHDALANLVDASDLRWIVLHRGDLTQREAARWAGALPGLQLVQRFGETDVYVVTEPRTRAWREQVQPRSDARAADTLQGASTAPLADRCRRGTIVAVDTSERFPIVPLAQRIAVRIRNDSDCTWPGVGIRSEGLVGLDYRWVAPSGHETAADAGAFSQLLADVAPHGEVDTAVVVPPPGGETGTWTLEIRLRQEGTRQPIATLTRPVEVIAPAHR